MMVPFQLSTFPVTPWKNGGGETREIICVPAPDAPFLWRASIATPAGGWPFLPLPWRRPGHYSAGGAAATAVWREYRPTAGALAAVGFPRRMGAVQRRDRCARAGLQYHDSARRASATVQVVSDLQCPASEGGRFAFYKASGIWPGRRCAAGSGLCWRGGSPRNLRPVGGNGRLLLAEIALK